jgi:type IV pilus assembly protein PilA
MKKFRNKKGFTLAELLIVVAIIAVLVAIAIPVFTGQLEKSRESTDAANIRNAYAENMVGILEDPTNTSLAITSVTFQQKQPGWQNSDVEGSLDALNKTNTAGSGDLDVEVTGTPDGPTGAAFSLEAGTSTANPKLTITIS